MFLLLLFSLFIYTSAIRYKVNYTITEITEIITLDDEPDNNYL
jgi:hypothetical protein